MKGLRTAFTVACLSTVYASAHAQQYGAEISYNSYGIYTSAGVYISAAEGDYYNLAPTTATGSGYVFSTAYGSYGINNDDVFGNGYSFALNQSLAGPGAGYALSGYGFEEFITFTNFGQYVGYFSVYSELEELQMTSPDGMAMDFGGIAEFGGQYFYGFNTVTLNGDGVASDYAFNWNVGGMYGGYGYASTYSYGGFLDEIMPGQSITVGVWASGITSATSTGSSVPGPVAVAPFALGLFGALRRRNKR